MIVPPLVLMARRAALVLVTACAFSMLVVSVAEALCVGASEDEHFARADIVFEGIAQPGNSELATLLSPATFEVERYLKGEGPARVQVATGTSDAGDGMYMTISSGIHPSAGDRWRIFSTGPADDVLETSTCHGSRRLEASTVTDTSEPSSSAGADLELARAEDGWSWLPLVATIMVLAAGMIGSRVRRRGGEGEETGVSEPL